MGVIADSKIKTIYAKHPKLTEPLRKLDKNSDIFKWSNKQQSSFEKFGEVLDNLRKWFILLQEK